MEQYDRPNPDSIDVHSAVDAEPVVNIEDEIHTDMKTLQRTSSLTGEAKVKNRNWHLQNQIMKGDHVVGRYSSSVRMSCNWGIRCIHNT